jgi:hypothetical protein
MSLLVMILYTCTLSGSNGYRVRIRMLQYLATRIRNFVAP